MATWPGLIAVGNLDILHRPIVHNQDGSISTVLSITIESDGVNVLIPTVLPNPARIVSNAEAISHYLATGENLGKFDSDVHAEAYAAALHVQQEGYYANPQPAHGPVYLVPRDSGPAVAPVIIWSQATDSLHIPAFGAHVPGDIFVYMIGTYNMSYASPPVWSVGSDPQNIYKPLGPLVTVNKPQFNLITSYWDGYVGTFGTFGNSAPYGTALFWARADYTYSQLEITPSINGSPYVAQSWSAAYIIRGTDPLSPIDTATVSPGPLISSNSTIIPGITTTTSNDLVLIGAQGVRPVLGSGAVGTISITPSLTQDYAIRTESVFNATSRNETGIHGTFPAGSIGIGIASSTASINWMSWMLAIRPDQSLYPEQPPGDNPESGGSDAHGNRHQSLPLGILGASLVKRRQRSGPN